MLISLRVEFMLWRKQIEILHNKGYTIKYKWNLSMIVFVQSSEGNVRQKISCFHLCMTVVRSFILLFVCFSSFGMSSLHKKKSWSCWLSFCSSAAVFCFSTNLYFSTMSKYACANADKIFCFYTCVKDFTVMFCPTLNSLNLKINTVDSL